MQIQIQPKIKCLITVNKVQLVSKVTELVTGQTFCEDVRLLLIGGHICYQDLPLLL